MIDKVYNITSAVFEPLERPIGPGWRVHVSVTAQNIQHIALPFRARVGGQPLEMLTVTAAGDRFDGYLSGLPQTGDRLFVGYGLASIPTDIVYGRSETRLPVA
jgi:hypothetical protein